MPDDRDVSAVACSLEQGDLAERLQRWHALGARAGADVVSTDTGLRLTFRADPGVEDELRELADLERQCCAFAAWSIHPEGEKVVLDVSGAGDEAIAAVQAMFRASVGRA